MNKKWKYTLILDRHYFDVNKLHMIHVCFFTKQDKLAKEERATKFNINKLNHQWRNIMRENKSKELKKDLEILSQTFERIVDRKDATIKSLAKDLQEADEQYSMALRAHLQNVDSLIGKQASCCMEPRSCYLYHIQVKCITFERNFSHTCHILIVHHFSRIVSQLLKKNQTMKKGLPLLFV